MLAAEYTGRTVKKPKHPIVAKWAQALFRESGASSQDAFAEKAGVSRSGFAKYFYGDQQPKLDQLTKLDAVAVDLGLPTLGEAMRGQAIEKKGMSDPRSTNAPSKDLEAFIARNAEDITDREKRFLRGLRFKGTPTDETWAALLEAFRAGRAAREGGGAGG